MYMCVYIYIPCVILKRCTETHQYQNISFQLTIQNSLRNGIQILGLYYWANISLTIRK